MKALLVSEYGALNGGEFSLLTALPSLQYAGFNFSAALPPDSDFAELLQKNGVQIEPFSFHDESGIRKPLQQIRDELSQLIHRLKPAIVHANSLSASRVLGPVTANADAVGLGYIRDIIKLSSKALSDVGMLDQIVAVSKATADFHIARGLPEDRVNVIHNGVDLDRFSPPREKPESKVCLCVGQIGMRKGLDLSLRALASVFEKVPEAELWIVGQRHSQKAEALEYENQLLKFAEQNFRQGAVRWLGRRSDMPKLMREARVLVHAAKQEPLGRVLLEATASGLPIVTTNVGGTPEILQGLESMMFEPDNFGDSEQTICRLLTDDVFHQKTSKQVRAIAEEKFSSKRAGENLTKLYLNCTESQT